MAKGWRKIPQQNKFLTKQRWWNQRISTQTTPAMKNTQLMFSKSKFHPASRVPNPAAQTPEFWPSDLPKHSSHRDGLAKCPRCPNQVGDCHKPWSGLPCQSPSAKTRGGQPWEMGTMEGHTKSQGKVNFFNEEVLHNETGFKEHIVQTSPKRSYIFIPG